MDVQNHLARIRKQRGWGVAQTAAAVGVTRQTIYAIEAGSYVPNTLVALKLAAAFDVTVEDLFFLGVVETDRKRFDVAQVLPGAMVDAVGQPVRLVSVGDRLVATDLKSPDDFRHPADGVVVKVERNRRSTVTVQTFSPPERLSKRMLVSGEDPSLVVLAHHLQLVGIDLVAVAQADPVGVLRRGMTHIAFHDISVDPYGKQSTFPVRKGDLKTLSVVALFSSEIGLALPAGNPKRIRTVADLARTGGEIVNREPGTAARKILDTALQQADIDPSGIGGYAQVVQGHMPAAWHVFMKRADGCIATRQAADAFGLDFVPLAKRQASLILRRETLARPEGMELIETVRKANFRHELGVCCGCDGETAGKILDAPPSLTRV